MNDPNLDSICRVPGIRVGHADNAEARTGCTVLLTECGAVGGVDVRGSSPGTREIELLKPVRNVEKIHAILLTGGSAFGLDAASGVMRFLEQKGVGYDVGVAKVPLVAAAVIFDLFVGDASVRPDSAMGFQACENATHSECREGQVGVGMGATVGKVWGLDQCSPGGVGTCAETLDGGIVVGVLVVVNAFGDVIDPNNGTVINPIKKLHGQPTDSVEKLKQNPVNPFARPGTNTTLAVVATNASLNKEQATKLAQMAQVGVSRTTRPAHTMVDGDVTFALSTSEKMADINVLGAVAADLVAEAVIRGTRKGFNDSEI